MLFGLLALTLAGCGDEATLREQAVVGPDPKLLPLRQTLFPIVQIAPQELVRRCKAPPQAFPNEASPKPNRRQRR